LTDKIAVIAGAKELLSTQPQIVFALTAKVMELRRRRCTDIFKHEMASGRAMLKTKLVAGWHRAIDEGQAWAIGFGLRTVLGLRDGASVPPLVPDAVRTYIRRSLFGL
jgi:hypothetical protein